jgi:PEP-CTERM motif
MSRQLAAAVCTSFFYLIASTASAVVVWDESVNGDVSNNPVAPTSINLAVGTNSFVATMPGDDLDFITINVPANSQFSALIQGPYDSFDQISFIAIGPGSQLPASILTYDPTGLLGYTHFGPGQFDEGTDLLPQLAVASFGVPGFATPLPSGAYSFWIQQESSIATSYRLDFVVTAVPEPASSVLFLLAGVGALCRRRRKPS